MNLGWLLGWCVGGWLVEVAGIEPASFDASTGLLRAQPVIECQTLRSPPAPAEGLSQLRCPRRSTDEAVG